MRAYTVKLCTHYIIYIHVIIIHASINKQENTQNPVVKEQYSLAYNTFKIINKQARVKKQNVIKFISHILNVTRKFIFTKYCPYILFPILPKYINSGLFLFFKPRSICIPYPYIRSKFFAVNYWTAAMFTGSI